MKIKPIAIGIMGFLCANVAAAATCSVADPTGTPLNVRSSPHGGIVGTAENGSIVQLQELRTYKGQSWARVTGAVDGWVFRSYLNCGAASSKPSVTSQQADRACVEWWQESCLKNYQSGINYCVNVFHNDSQARSECINALDPNNNRCIRQSHDIIYNIMEKRCTFR